MNKVCTVMNLVATHYNCTSPMDYISHHALHPQIPLHQSHSCHHSLINPDCLTTPAPHSLTHIKAAHKHSPSAKSCFPLANILSVSPVFWFPVFTWTAYLLWPFAACPFDPACLLISSLSAACPDLALSLLLILSSLHYSCYYLWPLPVWPPLVKIKLLLDLTTLPLHYNESWSVICKWVLYEKKQSQTLHVWRKYS